MSEEKQSIDYRQIWNKLWDKRKKFFWAWGITFVVAAALIFCVPKYYTCSMILAPESGSSSSSISSLASSFGISMGGSSSDAIYPTIYPDVLKSSDFRTTLFNIPIITADAQTSTTYYDYLLNEQKHAFWQYIPIGLSNLKRSIFPPTARAEALQEMSIPTWYIREDLKVLKAIKENITCSVDKKTEIIKVTVTDQDKLVCAIVVDSVCARIQETIINYRTQKAKSDMKYYETMLEQAKKDYDQACVEFSHFVDGNKNISLERYKIQRQNLENRVQLTLSVYTSFQKQYMTACARIQENTPAFTTVQSAVVPSEAAGPNRKLFVLAMLFLVTCIMIGIYCKEDIKTIIKNMD